MKINTKKTKAMIINFTNNHQFSTRMNVNNVNIELVDEMKILGTTITSNLTWNTNTQNIIKKVNKIMLLLKKIKSFGATVQEMVHLWIIYCRSVLEQSAIVWGSSLTYENKIDIERTKKSFTKMILKNKYISYEEALLKLNLPTLGESRQELSLKFAKNCLKNEKFQNLFPKNLTRERTTRHNEEYKIPLCHTNRMRHTGLTNMK